MVIAWLALRNWGPPPPWLSPMIHPACLFAFFIFHLQLHNTSKNAIMSANAWAILIVLGLGMTVAVEIRLGKKEPPQNMRHDVIYQRPSRNVLTVEANKLPPNQTACRCFLCEMTFTSMGLAFIAPPLKSSLILTRRSTVRLMSRCKRLSKSLYMVEPPESTMF